VVASAAPARLLPAARPVARRRVVEETAMQGSRQRSDIGWLLFGAIVLFVGGFFFLRNTLGWDIGDLDWEMIWPALVIALGISILWGGYHQWREGSHRR
jgi:uncharacterized integral membrane protein